MLVLDAPGHPAARHKTEVNDHVLDHVKYTPDVVVRVDPFAVDSPELIHRDGHRRKSDRPCDDVDGLVVRGRNELRDAWRAIPNLQQQGMGVTFGKTGIRIGENYNIDLLFLHLDHEIYYNILDQHDVTLVDEVADHPDTLYIPSEPTEYETFRGEKRNSVTNGNVARKSQSTRS